MNPLKSHWKWLKWLCAALVLAVLFYRHREELLALRERSIDWGFAALAVAFCTGALLLTFVRWYMLVWAQGFPFRLSDALRIGFIGYLFNYIAPGAVGGDLVRALMIAREQETRRFVAMSTVLLDRVLGLFGLFMVGAAAGLIPSPLAGKPELQAVAATFAVAGAVGLAGLGLVMLPGVPRSRWVGRLVELPFIGRLIGESLNAVLLYQSHRRVLAAAVAISIPGHVLMLSSFYCCARALHMAGSVPGYWEHLQFVPAAELAGVIVPLPGGIGALEGAIAYYYGVAGASPGDGFLTGIAYRVVTIAVALLGSGAYLSSRGEVESVLEEAGRPMQ